MKSGIQNFTQEFTDVRQRNLKLFNNGKDITFVPNTNAINSKAQILEQYLINFTRLNEREHSTARGILGEEFLRHLLILGLSQHMHLQSLVVIPSPIELDPTTTYKGGNGQKQTSYGGDLVIGKKSDIDESVIPLLLVDATVSTGKVAKKSHKTGGANTHMQTPVVVVALPRIQYGDHTCLTHYLDNLVYPAIQSDLYDHESPLKLMGISDQETTVNSMFSTMINGMYKTYDIIREQNLDFETQKLSLDRLFEARDLLGAVYEYA